MNFVRILFNENECTCVSNSVLETSRTTLQALALFPKEFFCINPLSGLRNDKNVTAYRNILVEFDVGSISEQLKMLKESKLPYSTLTFSGNKSLHAIISVEPAFKNEEEYRAAAKAIYAKLPGCDTKVCNPSRFSRTPGAIRDTGSEQTLLEVNARVTQDDLLAWIGPFERIKPRLELPKELWGQRMLPARVRHFLNVGAPNGSRNSALFSNACEMIRAGFSEDEIIEMVLSSALGLPDKEVRQCIRSAKKAVVL